MNRRDFLHYTSAASAASIIPFSGVRASGVFNMDFKSIGWISDQETVSEDETGNQRLSVAQLQTWEALGYGMFMHYGMSTFENSDNSYGDKPSSLYVPTALNVDQWVRTARDAGMKYVVLTAKHVSGHCLWHSKYTDYHVGTGSDKTDVVAAHVKACDKYGIMPGLYYCSWDNHHIMGSETPTFYGWGTHFASEEYQQFQLRQLEELMTQYGKIGEIWIDIPSGLTQDFRKKLYNRIAALQPETVIVMNQYHTETPSSEMEEQYIRHGWPSDVITYEKQTPDNHIRKWRTRTITSHGGQIRKEKYYMPVEVCYSICSSWFYRDDYVLSDAELLGMYLASRSRGANLLLNVPPNKTGQISQVFIDALMRLNKNIALIK